jgi:nicotinamide-nucleotide amidase
MNQELKNLSQLLGDKLKKIGLKLAVAESCTGGLLAATITSIAGSSEYFDCGFVTYSNSAKQKLLGVRAKTLEQFGAVSQEVALEMAEGVFSKSMSQVSMAITGIAGPGGATPDKSVGTVCFAWAQQGQPARALTKHFAGDRNSIQEQAVAFALGEFLKFLPVKNITY